MHGVGHADERIAFDSRESVWQFGVPTLDRQTGVIQVHFVGRLLCAIALWTIQAIGSSSNLTINLKLKSGL